VTEITGVEKNFIRNASDIHLLKGTSHISGTFEDWTATKIRQHARETGEFCNVETGDMKERSRRKCVWANKK
jgi:hypothetical protein